MDQFSVVHLDQISIVVDKNPVVKNLPALRPEQLPEFMAAIQGVNIERQTYYLMLWQLLTMTRPTEAAEVTWAEIDLNNLNSG